MGLGVAKLTDWPGRATPNNWLISHMTHTKHKTNSLMVLFTEIT
jgi:hypothetical protein